MTCALWRQLMIMKLSDTQGVQIKEEETKRATESVWGSGRSMGKTWNVGEVQYHITTIQDKSKDKL